MFYVNETVLYGTEGVCRIADIERKNFGGKQMEYYVLRPVYQDSSTIFVPLQNEALLKKMRRILSAEEIVEIIRAMPSEEYLWIEDEAERRETYKGILMDGDRGALVRLIKTLYAHQKKQQAKGKKLHISDERFLKEAEKILYDEFALVLNIKRQQVLPFILDQIQVEARQ